MPTHDTKEPIKLFSPERFQPAEIVVAMRSALLKEAGLNDPRLPKVQRILQRTNISTLLRALENKLSDLSNPDFISVADFMVITTADITLTPGATGISAESKTAIGRFMKKITEESRNYNLSRTENKPAGITQGGLNILWILNGTTSLYQQSRNKIICPRESNLSFAVLAQW